MNPQQAPISLKVRTPPLVEIFSDQPMDGPTSVVVHPLSNRVHMVIQTFMPPYQNPAVMMASFQLPYGVDRVMRALREAYLHLLPNVPLNVFDRYRIFKSFNMSIKILVWNVQGVGNKMAVIREIVRMILLCWL